MILQALCDYYQRKIKDPNADLAPRGFDYKAIPFVIVIDQDGRFIQLKDNRENIGKKLVGSLERVPKGKGRSGSKSYETAYCLWDHFGYVLNQPKVTKPGAAPTEKDKVMAEKQHQSFIRQIEQIAKDLEDDAGVQAVYRFLCQSEQIDAVKSDRLYQDCLKINGCNMAFELYGEGRLCCQSSKLVEWISKQIEQAEIEDGVCLVTGEKAKVARLHSGVSGILGNPVPLASINAEAYKSYGKEQGMNFPVSEQAMDEYAKALTYLLKNSDQRLQLGDTTLVCWSQKGHTLEKDIKRLFAPASTDDPDRGTDKLIDRYKSPFTGAAIAPDDQQRFYILGLAPNPPARIAIRFWMTGTVAEFSQKIGQWFQDIDITGRAKFGYPGIRRLLLSTALRKKDKKDEDKNISPVLVGEVYRAIFQGQPMPETLLVAVIRRLRAEKGHVSYERACLIKACLNRRKVDPIEKEVSVSLDKTETNIGYRLGRLFAVLELLEQAAHEKKINSTIRDRYYSSASSTPGVVFPTLIRRSSFHLNKVKKQEKPAIKTAASFDWDFGAIIDELSVKINFPNYLTLKDQGLFAIGYYHQKYQRADFTKAPSKQGEQPEEVEA